MDAAFGPLQIMDLGDGFFALKGELDLSTGPFVDDTIGTRAGAIVLDLSEITFVDSYGLRSLIAIYRRCQADGSEFRIKALSRSAERLLEVAGLLDVLTE